MPKKNSKQERDVVLFSKSNKVSREPMSLAMSYLPYTTVLEINIYYSTLNKIVLNEFKDRDLFDATIKVVIPAKEVGETHFPRLNKALKNVLNAKLSLINERKEFCRHLVPIIGTEYAKNTGRIYVSLHPEVLDEYRNMIERGYTNYLFMQMLTLSRFFSKRLYEILSGRVNVNGGVWSIEIDILKRLLSAESCPNNVFVQRALKETAQEFEDKDIDIRFTYELVKGTKNRIEKVIFTITPVDDGELGEYSTMSSAESKELTLMFEQLSARERSTLVATLLSKSYAFKHTQVNEIISSPVKMALFYSTHNKIETGIIKNVRNRTRYMAKILGYKNSKD